MRAPVALHIATPADAKPETVAQRVRRLQAEAKALAKDHVSSLLASMTETEGLAREIASGGEIYHPGAQERARRIADELASQRATLEAIARRVG